MYIVIHTFVRFAVGVSDSERFDGFEGSVDDFFGATEVVSKVDSAVDSVDFVLVFSLSLFFPE